MGRKAPSVQSDSDRLEPKLVRAVEANSVPEVEDIIRQAQSRQQCTDVFLGVGLIKACDKNLPAVARFLLENGAHPDYAPANKPASLLRAADFGRMDIAEALIDHGANLETGDKKGRTALMTAAYKGHSDMVRLLLARGAHIETRDHRQRNVLHNLAADKGRVRNPGTKPSRRWNLDVVHDLLQAGVDVEAQDEDGRTPLHWCCVTDLEHLLKTLLTSRTNGAAPKANVNAKNDRQMTPIQFAAARNHRHLVQILLEHNADVLNTSDGGWTALHNACTHGSKDLLELLLAAGAEINGELMNGRTPLHVAAETGNKDAVAFLLLQSSCKSATRDRFGNTPLLLAAQHRHKDIAEMLAPWNHLNELSEEELDACRRFRAKIVDFGDFPNGNRVMQNPPTIYDLLYAKDPGRGVEPLWTTMPKKMKATNLRWIHLPANNVAWCDALLKKRFIEEEVADVDGYKALETSFNHQHRGHHHHSRFMRPMCQVVRRTAGDDDQGPLASAAAPTQSKKNSRSGLAAVQEAVSGAAPQTTPPTQNGEQPLMPHLQRQNSPHAIWGAELSSEQRLGTNAARPQSPRTESTSTAATTPSTITGKQRGRPAKAQAKRQETTSTVSASESSSNAPANGQSTIPASRTKTAKRPVPAKASRSTTNATTDRISNSCNLFMFMPYLHFETHRRRKEMQRALEHPDHLRGLSINAEADEILIRAHLSKSSSFLHVRRTLDQFFYHNIDTRYRDEDQVVFRFQRDLRDAPDPDPKIFMVDQLWMWIVGRDLIVTSFPQRWKQPRNDPLDVFEGIVEDINSIKMRDPVQNVYELAMTIAGRCFGTFDRHRKNDDGFQFLDMFGASLGVAMDREAKRFQEFSRASEQASIWLRSHKKPNKILRNLEVESKVHQHAAKRIDNNSPPSTPEDPDTEFIDKLLDVGPETDLLAEIKDIRDELDILKMVLRHQENLLPDLQKAITTLYQDDRSLGALRKVTRTFEEQEKTITNPLKDIERMEDQAKRIYESIRDLLDLKQKHANAFEARFAREQALGAQRQGQTIMVFTIVTVIFLPLSFIAAFFAINVESFPHNAASGQPEMSLGYVSQYIFGIGLAISIPCIAIALSVDELSYRMKRVRLRLRQWWPTWAGGLRWGRREKEDMEYERQMLKIEHTVSVARSLRRSGEITWKDAQMDATRGSGVYHRRRPSLWDEEAARRM